MNIIYQGAKIQKILERYGIFKNFITENNYGKSFDNKNKHEKDVIHSRVLFVLFLGFKNKHYISTSILQQEIYEVSHNSF